MVPFDEISVALHRVPLSPNSFQRLFANFMATGVMRLLYECRSLEELAKLINPRVQGWINYFGKFYPSELRGVLSYVEATLVRWAMEKYKKLRGRKKRAGVIKSVPSTHYPACCQY